jgi:hypothetical protein
MGENASRSKCAMVGSNSSGCSTVRVLLHDVHLSADA